MGLSEILAILLSLSGFGIAPSPTSPSAAEITRYAPDDTELFFYLDWSATVPGNWAAFEKLPQAPAVRASPKALRTLTDLVAKAKKERRRSSASCRSSAPTSGACTWTASCDELGPAAHRPGDAQGSGPRGGRRTTSRPRPASTA